MSRATPPLVRHAAALRPVLRAVAASAGAEARSCLIDRDGTVERAATALTLVRALADSRGPDRLLARVLREMLFEADRDLGDGTARLALLWGGIVLQGAQSLASGIAPERLATELERLAARLSEALTVMGEAAGSGPRVIAAVAASAGATADIADAVADMVTRVGAEGSAEIVPSLEPGIRLESGEGFLFEAVPVSDQFARADLDPAFVLVADERIDEFGPLVPLLEGFATRGKALVVVARDVSGPALHALVRNHRENGLRAIALRPAVVGQAAADHLDDLAMATGATPVAERCGTSLATLRPGMLGRCARVTLSGRLAAFQQPQGDMEAVETRRRQLLAEADRQKFLALDRERLQARAARLRGAWARLHVGPESDRSARDRIEASRRALASARWAAAGGAVPGGGLGLVHCFDSLPIGQAEQTDPHAAAARQAMAAGLSAVVHGLSPWRDNAHRPVSATPGALGAALGLSEQHVSAILDPLDLTRSVLARAVSGAVPLLRSGALVGD